MAKIVEFSGEVLIKKQKKDWIDLTEALIPFGLDDGDALKTKNGRLEFSYVDDGSCVRVMENSYLVISYRKDPAERDAVRDVFSMFGHLFFDVKPHKNLETTFSSRTAVAGIRGTSGEQETHADGTTRYALKRGEMFINGLWLRAGKQRTVFPDGSVGQEKEYPDTHLPMPPIKREGKARLSVVPGTPASTVEMGERIPPRGIPGS